jgi:Uma2 family endonuclease
VVAAKLMTIEELEALPDDDRFYELIEGELIELSPTGIRHGDVVSLLVQALNVYAANRSDIRIWIGETGYVFGRNPDTVLAPDIAILTKAQLEATPRTSDRFNEVVPAIVIEVKSPSNREAEIAKKLGIYLAAGVKEVWWVRPNEQQMMVHRQDRAPVTFNVSDMLGNSELLPGFELRLSELFGS